VINHSPPPPPPILYAQLFQDSAHTFDIAPNAGLTTTTTSNTAQRPVDTIAVMNYLRSKYIGLTVGVTDTQRAYIGQGVAVNVSKVDTGYTCDIRNPDDGEIIPVRVIFEGFVQDAPSQKRWAMRVQSQVSAKRLVESESQLTTALSGLGSETIIPAVSPTDRLPEPTADVLPTGEELQVLDIKTNQMGKQFVVIYKGTPYLSTGVPLNVRLEYQP